MSRKRVTADELSWMIFKQTRDELGAHGAISVAIVPNGADGWAVLFPKRLQRSNPAAVALIQKFEKKLQAAYILKS
jgi:hypothetical protein